MTFHPSILQELKVLASNIPSVGGARIAACLSTRSGEIISYGINHKKSHPFQKRYSINPEKIWFHAETHCIHNALKTNYELENLYLYLVRVKRNFSGDKQWHSALVEPCEGCMKCIRQYNIKEIFTSF